MSTITPAQVTPERIMQFAWAYAPSLIIEAAIRNNIFDELDAGPKTAQELAAATGASERGVTAIANVLVGLELLAKNGAGKLSLTPESSAFLVRSKPSFMGGFILHTSGHLIPRWLHLNDVVRTGVPVSPSQSGGDRLRILRKLRRRHLSHELSAGESFGWPSPAFRVERVG